MSERSIVVRVASALLVALLAGAAAGQEAALRDPMQPFDNTRVAGDVGVAPSRLELTAVLIAPARRVAVINGSIRRIGDWVEGAQITRIETQVVHLRREGEDIVVRLERRRTESQDEGEPAS